MPFEGFDFTGFWDDCDYALKAYVCDPPTDQLIAEIEQELGYKLPASYIWLMKQHNGGIPANTCFPTGTPTSWAEDHVAISGIFGIGRDKNFSLCGGLGSQFMIDEWEYPAIGVAICTCPSAGHDMIFLDYRGCGPQGEPAVVHIDQESDYQITPLADSFEDFIRGLASEDEYAEDPDERKSEELTKVLGAPFSPLLLKLCQKSGDPDAVKQWIRDLAAQIVEEKGFFALHGDEPSYVLYDIQFWLYENAHPGVTQSEFLDAYPRIIQLASGFSTGGYAPGFIAEWLKERKRSGAILERDGALSLSDGAKDALAEQLERNSAQPNRPDACAAETLGDEREQDFIMDGAIAHLENIKEKNLPVDEITAYNHLAIYLRWCMEHDLMSAGFLQCYGMIAGQAKAHPEKVLLREFLRDVLDGLLLRSYFNEQGAAFADYYYGEGGAPYFPADIDDYALTYFGQARYHSDEFQDEAYLFVPFDEDYYQGMARVIGRRWSVWQQNGQVLEDAEPSDLAKAMMAYLDCPCQYFPPMTDDDPITAAYGYARRRGQSEGYIPVLVTVDDTLWECLIMNSDPDSDGADGFSFDPIRVSQYRQAILARPVEDGKAVLDQLIVERREEAEDDDMDWPAEILGETGGGEKNDRFLSYWSYSTGKTLPLILAKIPARHPWEVFAYLPFGGWNECPNTPELMAIAKHWNKQHGAVPAAMTHDELEFSLPVPVPREQAIQLALEQYGFCPDVVDQGGEDATVGTLADTLSRSAAWYFWWD